VTATLRRAATSSFVRQDLGAAIVPWIVARVLVVGSLGLARFVFDEVGSGRRPVALTQGLYAWDASWYRSIAEQGYASLPRPALRFFPLFPLLGRWLGEVFLDHPEVALLVIANAAALVFAALLHRLTMQETGDAALARRAAWYAAILPPAMFLVLGYADALAMCFAVGVFLCMRSGRWVAAIPLGVLAGICRPVGVLLVVPLAVEAWRGFSASSARDRAARVAAVVAPVAGLAAYLAWVGTRFGDAFEPLTVQNRRDLRGGFVDPVTRVIDAIGDLGGGDRFGSGLHIVWVALCAVLVVLLARRLPASYAWYGATAVVLALTARNLDSFERYAMSTFPLVIGVGLLVAREQLDKAVLALAAGGLVLYSTLAFLGQYVP
jgi:hypothetical protein